MQISFEQKKCTDETVVLLNSSNEVQFEIGIKEKSIDKELEQEIVNKTIKTYGNYVTNSDLHKEKVKESRRKIETGKGKTYLDKKESVESSMKLSGSIKQQ